MSDENELAPEAGQEVVAEAQEAAGQVEDQTAEDAGGEGEKPEAPESEEEKKRKESAKERRERAKQAQQRLREGYGAALAKADDAERKLKAITDAGNRPAPTREQFADVTEFAAASAVWKYQQEAARADANSHERDVEQARQQVSQIEHASRQLSDQNWTEQHAEGRALYADFDQVALSSPISDTVAEMVKASDVAAELAYYLGKNPDAARQLSLFAAVQPKEAARQMAFMETQIRTQAAPRPAPRTESKAPPPITPGKASGTGVKSPDKMSAEEYRAWRESGGKF